MERPTTLTEELDKLQINRLEAVSELNKLGDKIAKDLLELKSGGGTSLILSGLFPQQENFSSEEVLNTLDSLVANVESKINSNNKLANLDGMSQVLLVFKTLRYSPPIQMTLEEIVRITDSCLVDIANSDNIPIQTKSKFFDLLAGIIDENTNKWLANQLENSNEVPTNSILPINVSYLLDIPNAVTRIEQIRKIKTFIKNEFTKLKNDPEEVIMQKYGDYMVDSEIEEYVFQQQYNSPAPSKFIESSIPETILENATDELKEVLTSDAETVSTETLRLAKVQLLRIYREYVNLLLNGTNLTKVIIKEQSPQQLQDFDTDLRIGGKDDEQKSSERSRKNRRVALFGAQHLGTVKSNQVNSALDNNNYLPVSQKIIDFWLEDEKTNIEAAEIKLSEENLRKLEVLKSIKDLRLPQKYLTDDKFELNGQVIPEGLPCKITEAALRAIGIGSSEEVSEKQIEIEEKKLPADKSIKTYAVKVSPSGNVSVNGHYRIFNLQDTYDKTLKGLMTTITHEVGHIFQQYATDATILPGMSLLSSVGRSEVSGEGGAIKIDAIMRSLFGDEREVNTYHFDIVRLIIEGKNYWEIFNEVFKILNERNIRKNEGLSKKDLIKITQKAIRRGYGNLASMSNATNEGRYPTSTGFLSYTYQGIPGFSEQPFYVSGVPTHRNDLKEFMPLPEINGEPINESFIIRKIIEATYQVLLEYNIIQEEH